jgi:hypothetical protein
MRLAGFPDPPDEEGHIRALPAPVGVQLVEDQEAQALGRSDQLAVTDPGKDQLEHHIVGEDDVGR